MLSELYIEAFRKFQIKLAFLILEDYVRLEYFDCCGFICFPVFFIFRLFTAILGAVLALCSVNTEQNYLLVRFSFESAPLSTNYVWEIYCDDLRYQ